MELNRQQVFKQISIYKVHSWCSWCFQLSLDTSFGWGRKGSELPSDPCKPAFFGLALDFATATSSRSGFPMNLGYLEWSEKKKNLHLCRHTYSCPRYYIALVMPPPHTVGCVQWGWTERLNRIHDSSLSSMQSILPTGDSLDCAKEFRPTHTLKLRLQIPNMRCTYVHT